MIQKDDQENLTIIEELFDEFTVVKPNCEERAAAYEISSKKIDEGTIIQGSLRIIIIKKVVFLIIYLTSIIKYQLK